MWKLRCLLLLVLCLGALEAVTCKKGKPCFDNCIYKSDNSGSRCNAPGDETCERSKKAGYECCSGQEACDAVFGGVSATTRASTLVPARLIKCRGGEACNGVMCAWKANNVKGGEYDPPHMSYCKNEWTSCKDADTKKCCDDKDYCDEEAFPPAPSPKPPKGASSKTTTMLVVAAGLLVVLVI